jgi:hypothetical protein
MLEYASHCVTAIYSTKFSGQLSDEYDRRSIVQNYEVISVFDLVVPLPEIRRCALLLPKRFQ